MVYVSTDKSTYTRSTKTTVSVTVRTSTPNVAMYLTLTSPTGKAVGKSSTTDGNGIWQTSLSLNKNSLLGICTLTAYGTVGDSGSTTFTLTG